VEVIEMAKSKTAARAKKRPEKVVYRLGKVGTIELKAIREAVAAVKKLHAKKATA
jgi:hypothetical protein